MDLNDALKKNKNSWNPVYRESTNIKVFAYSEDHIRVLNKSTGDIRAAKGPEYKGFTDWNVLNSTARR